MSVATRFPRSYQPTLVNDFGRPFQRGFNKLDNNLRINCQLNGDCLYDVFPDRYDPAIVVQTQNSGTIRNFFIKPASFTKLREMSLSPAEDTTAVTGAASRQCLCQ